MNEVIHWVALLTLAVIVALFLRWLWFQIQAEAVIIEAEEIKNAQTD